MLPFTLQQLRILKVVATEKNFTKAATVLYLSQPSLSKQIKILEKNLDVRLINRERNKLSLTESGQVLLQYSERILGLCEESCRALIDLKNGERGNLTIGTCQTIGMYLMPRILAIFTQSYPQIKLNLQVNSSHIIAKNIKNQKIDIGIIGGKLSEDLQGNITIHSFVYDKLSLIISKSHPFAKKKKITKKDLYCIEFITLNSHSTLKKFIENTLSQNQIDTNQLKTIFELNSIEGIKTAVSLGLGAAFVSSSAIEKEIQLETIKVIQIDDIRIKRKLSIISNSESYKSKAFELFYTELNHLKNKIEN